VDQAGVVLAIKRFVNPVQCFGVIGQVWNPCANPGGTSKLTGLSARFALPHATANNWASLHGYPR
jgi:hypothetical protein